jgi:hypothetical protein
MRTWVENHEKNMKKTSKSRDQRATFNGCQEPGKGEAALPSARLWVSCGYCTVKVFRRD